MSFRHELTGIVINNFGLKKLALILDLVYLCGFSNTNIGFEYASRGTDSNTTKKILVI